jgi:crossover junction endodeoxyribonuclease RuvC
MQPSGANGNLLNHGGQGAASVNLRSKFLHWARPCSAIHCSHMMRVLGIDCGGEYTGYGVVEMRSSGQLCCLTCGAIKLSPRDPLPRRLSQIFTQLGKIIVEHHPEEVAIEDVFYALNVKSALKLGQVRGVAMLAAAAAGLEVAEYSPLTIKSSVVGYGRAEKQQVQHMVTRLLELAEPPEPMDASDALAIAICHLHTAGTLIRQRAVAR